MADVIQIRRDTAENWTKANPVLAQGEFGFETDTLKLKVGDGSTTWVSLRYYRSEDSYTAGDGISIQDFVVSNTGVRSLATGSANGTIKVNGTTDVSVKGLGTAAYTASNAYATAAQGTKADNAADKDLSNLTTTGANIGNWSTNVTNCITEIPQNVNFTLSNGTLTLKAGSKVYFPNGAGVFDSYILPSDKSTIPSSFSTSSNRFVIVAPDKNIGMVDVIADYIYSGTTAPTTFDGNGRAYWYDTTNNVIKRTQNSGSTWTSGYSFPVAIVDVTNGVGVSKIDQVFNGFGYIGSTVFALPGVKGLIPNGRNADGTLNNTEFSISSVMTRTFSTHNVNYAVIGINPDNSNIFGVPANAYYDERNNFVIENGIRWPFCLIGKMSLSSGTVTYFRPDSVFHALDYNDTEFIAHQATPSDKYVDMTLPASGNAIAAPADGYFAVGKNATASGQRLRMWYRGTNSGDLMSASTWSSIAANLEISLYVAKGSSVVFVYSADGTTNYCRFIYANGAK